MLRDVKHTVTDGLLGFATATGDGKSLKIGVSPIVSDTPIIITGDMDATKIKDRLGLSPLADAVMDSVQFGASRIYCLPVSATTAGKLGIVSKTGDGGGSVTVDGSPTNAFSVVVKFTAQGQLNTAAFVYSIDGETPSRTRSPSPSMASMRSPEPASSSSSPRRPRKTRSRARSL